VKDHGLPPAHAEAPNLAPMVDVVMVILIFFMLGTTFAVFEGVLPTQLPSQIGPGGAASVTILPTVRIALLEGDGGQCRIVVIGGPAAMPGFEALAAFLRERIAAGADPEGRVLIEAEPSVAYQQVVSAMDACVRAGFGHIQFSVSGAAMAAIE